ncbi:MAG: hypothetical protein PWR20_501 [Bacteroidales bacterium]|nr:hypothetical protein [Bacteroidales bacterium]MDN5328955.1 hypothetical protein [Bacteroidales bacterium]
MQREIKDMKQAGENKLSKSKIDWIIRLVGAIIGIAGGYLYYIKVGCNSGSCPITSNPWMSMLWGGLMGYVIADLIPARKKKEH